MSKKIFSAQDWENAPSEIQSVPIQQILPVYNKVEEDVECVVREIEQRAIDIAPSYKDWVELGFALVDGLGESGREYYHRISRFYPTYQREETDKQYTHCLQSKGQGITIRSFFHLANQAGISSAQLGKKHLSILPNIQNGKMGKWIKSEEGLPAFPECVFDIHFKESDKDSISEKLMLSHTRSAFSASLLLRCRESFSSFSSMIDCALKSRISKRVTSSIITKVLPFIESGVKC